ncbi:hypothetical protein Cfor_08819 [Coptotermes formosanus]|uniref:protein-L-isoaspartate(D-aspartate) O-methyltransferase n=1 Tax=Coptotermes formosanus TaxID=36987 RepID=A0A6L2Q4Q5_COPFO|nr:hypothetical protein Cfor_08819 [Coptotermes formosanus]
MAWRSHGRDNSDMVRNLRANGIIRSQIVEDVMLQVDRGKYAKFNPYMDAPQGIGYGVTISAPHMHAHALELLKDHLKEGERALDVGSGSGYLTVCMALMVGETGMAVGIDHIPELVDFSRSNVQRDKPTLLESNRLKLIGHFHGNGYSQKQICCTPYQPVRATRPSERQTLTAFLLYIETNLYCISRMLPRQNIKSVDLPQENIQLPLPCEERPMTEDFGCLQHLF